MSDKFTVRAKVFQPPTTMKIKKALLSVLCLFISFLVIGSDSNETQQRTQTNLIRIDEVTTCNLPVSQVSNPTLTSYFSDLLSTEHWPARWTCGEWSQTEGWLYISSDLSIFLAYLSIPIMLLWFIRKMQLGRLRWLIALFGAFILLCGFTHLIDVVLFWEPMYRLSGFAKLLTGVVSLATATVLGFVIPKALAYKSPEVLQAEIDKKKTLQNQLESFVKYSPGAIAMFDNDMRYIMANDGWYEDYGLKDIDIIGKSHYEIFPMIKEMPHWLDDHKRALNGETLKKELDVFESGDQKIYLSWQLMPWYNSDDSIGGILMFTEILTDEVFTKKRLAESEQRFTNIFNKAQFGIALVNSEGRPFLVNKQLCEIIGYTEEELLKMTFDEFTHPEDIQKDMDHYTKLLADEIDSYTIDKRYVNHEGKVSYVKLNVTLVDDPEIDDRYALAVVEDLTEQILTEKKEREAIDKATNSYKLLGEVSQLGKIGAWEVDVKSDTCEWSNMVYDIHELERGTEVKVEDGINFYHPDHRSKINEAVGEAISENKSWDLELKIITAKGNERWVRAIGQPVKNAKGEVLKLRGLFQDIHKEATQRLELQEKTEKLLFINKQFELARNASEFGIWDWDIVNNTLTWDHQMFRLYGFDESDFGNEYEAWQNGVHPEDREQSHQEVQDALKGIKEFDTQFRVQWPNGEVRHLRAMSNVFFEDGKPVRMLGTNWDITKEVEREQTIVELNANLQTQVEDKTRDLKLINKELESFSYSVSHDLRAPLRAINGFSEAILEDFNKDVPEGAKKYLKRISANSQKMGQLIDDLLAFSRMNRKKVDYAEVDTPKLIKRIIRDVFYDSTDTIKIEDLPSIYGDELMVNQVFTNLISNAIKYSSKERKPEIVISAEESEEDQIISVKDNGVGFNMEYYDKLFQVFQRLHSESEFEGTGVGLSLCAKIMHAHEGDIWAESEEGKGTIFYLKFKKEHKI